MRPGKEIILQGAEWLGARFVSRRTVGPAADVRAILAAEAGGIGDLINFYPALYSLRLAFPGAHIALLAGPAAGEISRLWPERCHDELLTYDWQGAHRSPAGKLRLVRQLRRNAYDLIYSPDRGSGMREESLMAFLVGARHRLGFCTGDAGALCTASVQLAGDVPVMEQNLEILRAAGIPVTRPAATLRIDTEHAQAAERLLVEHGLTDRRIVVVHACADWEGTYRAWPPERFARAAGEIVRRASDVAVVVVGTRREEPVASNIVATAADSRVISLCGHTTLGALAALVQRASLVIGNDSSLLHMAAAVGTPMVAIFGSTHAAQVLPATAAATVVTAPVGCRPCYFHQERFAPPCGRPRVPPCLDGIQVEQVVAAAIGRIGITSPATASRARG
jgi:heptosyltransferase-2